MPKLLIISFLCATMLIAGCSGQKVPFVHRMDIPQGNVVTEDMLNRLEPGLSKRQVTFIMGSPMLVDVFNQEEWVYLYSFKPGDGERVQRRVSLYFDEGRLARVSGDTRLTEDLPLAVRSASGTSRAVEVPEGVGSGYEDGGILQGVIDRFTRIDPLGDDEETPEDAPGGGEKTAGGEPAGDASASETTDRGAMQRFSLEGGDVGSASAEADSEGGAGDAPPEEPARATDGGTEATPSFFQRLKRSLGMGEEDEGEDGEAEGTGR